MLIILALVNLSKCCCLDLLLSERGCLPGICVSGVGRCRLCSVSPHNLDMLQTAQSVTPKPGHVANCAVCHPTIWTCCKLCSLSPHNLDMLQTVQSVTPQSGHVADCAVCHAKIWTCYKLCSLSPQNLDTFQTVQSVTPKSGHVADCAVCHPKIFDRFTNCAVCHSNIWTGLQTVQSVTPKCGHVGCCPVHCRTRPVQHKLGIVESRSLVCLPLNRFQCKIQTV